MQQVDDGTTSNQPAAQSTAGVRGNVRWSICALLFFGTAINYIDRQILGLLKPTLQTDLHIDDQGFGFIVAVFQFTYAFGYLFGGRLMDVMGVKKGYPLIATVWSLAAAAHGFARNIVGFSVARFVLGASEGGNFPAAIRTVTEWFPLKERALATGIFNSASNIGAIVGPLTVPLLAARYGWQAAFFITGVLGLIWVVAWAVLYNPPDQNRALSSSEREYIEGGRATTEPARRIPFLRLLKSRPALAYALANVFSSPVWWFYLFWLPDALKKQFKLDLITANRDVAIVYAISIVGSVAGGWLAQRLIASGMDLTRARKTAMFIPALCVVPVCIAGWVHNLWIVIGVIGLAAAAHQAWSANLYTFVSDTMPKSAVGSVVGLGGLTGGLAGSLVAYIIGTLLKATQSYVPEFIWASTMYILSFAIIHFMVPKIEMDKTLEAEMAASTS